MATYYWTGASGSDVNSRFNWSLYGPSVSQPPTAPTKPALDSDIIFDKWPSTYPVNIPMGFLHFGNTAAGATALKTNSVTVKPNYNLDIGRGGTYSGAGNCYFHFYSKNLILGCNNTDYNNPPKRYFNAYDGAGVLGATANVSVKFGATGYQTVYFNGNIGNLTSQASGVPLRSAIYFNGATANGSGGTMDAVNFDGESFATLINIWNPKSNEMFNFSDQVLFAEGSVIAFSGENNTINIEGGVQWGDVTIVVSSEAPTCNSQLNLLDPRIGNDACFQANPPEICFTPSVIDTIKLNSISVNMSNPYPKIIVEHGCFVDNFRLEKGEAILRAKTNQAFYIRGGYANPVTSIIKDETGCLEIQDNELFSSGFVIKNQPGSASNNFRSAVNYNVRMLPTDPGYSYGTE